MPREIVQIPNDETLIPEESTQRHGFRNKFAESVDIDMAQVQFFY